MGVRRDAAAAEDDGEVFVLRNIIHDWDDGKALAILRSVRAAIGHRCCTLAIIEVMASPGERQTFNRNGRITLLPSATQAH